MTHNPIECPHCRRLLDIPEIVEKWCVACGKATDVRPEPVKRAA